MAMHITTKGCYGLRAMIDLAEQSESSLVPMELISNRLDVSRKYLHSLLTSLKNAGLVQTTRGAGGGFRLAREAGEIKVTEVIEALEGRIVLRECIADPECCERATFCVTRTLWIELERVITSYFDALTIEDLKGQNLDWVERLREMFPGAAPAP